MANFNSNIGVPLNRIDQSGSTTSYEFDKLSIAETNVITLVFDQMYKSGVKSAYDPTQDSTFSENYTNNTSPYIVKQLDPNNGSVTATGVLLRYVPSDNQQTVFIKVKSGVFNNNNGVVFANRKSVGGNGQTTPFTQAFSFGSSISSIRNLNNVMKITFTYTTEQTTVSGSTASSNHFDYGDFIFNGNILIKKASTTNLDTGTLISSGKIHAILESTDNGDGSTTKSYIVSLNNADLARDITNGGTISYLQTCCTDFYYMEDAEKLSGSPCGRFAIDNVVWVNINADKTPNTNINVQEIIFKDSTCTTSVNYAPTLGNDLDLYQYNIESTSVINGSEVASKIEGETLSWTAGSKTLIAISGTPFDERYGTIYYTGATSCSSGLGGNSYNNNKSNFNLRNGFFANLSEKYNGGDYSIAARAVQNISLSNSWNPSYTYSVGDIVSQYNNSGQKIANFKVESFSKAQNFGLSTTQPTSLLLKQISENDRLNMTNSVGLNTKILPSYVSYNSTEAGLYPKLVRTVVSGNIQKVYVNTPQILPDTTVLENIYMTSQPSSFFAKGNMFASTAGYKIATCIINQFLYYNDVLNSKKFKLSLSDIRPYDSSYTLADIIRSTNVFVYNNKALFNIIPESTKYNKIIFNYSGTSTSNTTANDFSIGDILTNDNGTSVQIVNKTVLTGTIEFIINRLNQDDKPFINSKVVSYTSINFVNSVIGDLIPTRCISYSNILLENQTKNGFVFPIQNGYIFSEITPSIIPMRKIISNKWNAGSNSTELLYTETGGGSLQGTQKLFYHDATGFKINTSSGTGTSVSITKPSGTDKDSFLFSSDYTINLSNSRIKNLTSETKSRTLHYDLKFGIYCYLTRSDVYRINEIIYDGKNITKWFKLDSGETKDVYGFSKIIFNNDYASDLALLLYGSTITSINNLNELIALNPISLNILYSYFDHTNSNNVIGPIIRNSYLYGGSSIMSIEDIGYTIAGELNEKIHRSAVIDFRPIYTLNSNIDASVNPYSNPNNITISNLYLPNEYFSIAGKHYIPRKDSLYLTSEGEFLIEQGIPSINPQPPEKQIDNAMKLNDLFIPAYTINATDIKQEITENRRYTMRDIGKLESRIKRVEYYTNLSLVEKKASDMIITDSNGLTRSKNGIIVDNYDTFLIINNQDKTFNACIDTKHSTLRHPFLSSRFGFKLDNTTDFRQLSHNPEITGFALDIRKIQEGLDETSSISTGLYMLNPSAERTFIIQPFASSVSSVVPLDTFMATGIVTLQPPVDDWVEKIILPPLTVDLTPGLGDMINNITQSLENNNIGVFGTKYGEEKVTTSTVVNNLGHARGGTGVASNITTQTTTQDVSRTTAEIAVGTVNLGERLTDIEIAHYIREQTIYMYITGLKPKTRLYVFLDDINVDEYCSLVTGLNRDTLSRRKFKSDGFRPSTDLNGNAIIQFDMVGSKYRTGDRVFNITDSVKNDKFGKSTTMYATGVFSASGLTKTAQSTEAVSRTFSLHTEKWTESKTLEWLTKWDPIAQTFNVNKDLYPSGIYLKSVDLCFSTKDPSVPVIVQIRPTVNGFPDSNKVYAYGNSIMSSSNVNAIDELDTTISPDITNSAAKTTFIFDPPVYLEPGEHALVVHSTSELYKVYTAARGETDLNTNTVIDEQPYVGEFFRSSNGSTWIPDGQLDLTFALNLLIFEPTASITTPIVKQVKFTIDTIPAAGNPSSGLFGLFESNPDQLSYETFTIKPYIKDILGTSTKTAIQLTSGNDIITYNNVLFDNTFNLPKSMVLKKSDSANTITMEFATSIYDPYVSPIINIQKSAIVLIRNMIDSSETGDTSYSQIINNELLPIPKIKDKTLLNNAPATMRYITKTITLADKFDAINCKVLLSIHKPSGTNVAVFVKTEPLGSFGKFEEYNYQLMTYNGNNFSSKDEEFNEMEFNLSENIDPFTKFAFKICLFSSDSSVVPQIKDFIGIAIS